MECSLWSDAGGGAVWAVPLIDPPRDLVKLRKTRREWVIDTRE